jgi:hypothetical protein
MPATSGRPQTAKGLSPGMTVGAGGGRGQRRGSFIGGRSPEAPRALAASPAAMSQEQETPEPGATRAGLRCFVGKAANQNGSVTSAVIRRLGAR